MKIYKKSQNIENENYALKEPVPSPIRIQIFNEIIDSILPIVEKRVNNPEQAKKVINNINGKLKELSGHIWIQIDHAINH